MHRRTARERLPAAPERRLRIVRLDHDVTEQLAAEAEHRRVKHALLRRLPHVAGKAHHEHHVHRRLVVADDDTGRLKSAGRDVLKFQFAERHSFHHAARHPARGAAQAIVRRAWRNEFQDGAQHAVQDHLAAAEMDGSPERAERMPPAGRAARRDFEEQQIHAQRRENERGGERESHAEQNRGAHRIEHRMICQHEHAEAEDRRSRGDQHRGTRGGGSLRPPAPFVQFAGHQEHTVIFAHADDENDEHAVHQINRQAQPAHRAECPQQAEEQRQQHHDCQFDGAERKIDNRAHDDAGPQREMSQAVFRQPGDVIGERLRIEHDHSRQRTAQFARVIAVFQFDECADRGVVRAGRNALVQRLLQRCAAKHFQRQQLRLAREVLPEFPECLAAKTKLAADLLQGLAQRIGARGRPEFAPAAHVRSLRRL